MMRRSLILVLPLLCWPALGSGNDAPMAKRTLKEALQPFNDLIGTWRATCEPGQGTREEKQKNFWTEGISWEWQFKGDDAWLKVAFDKGKHYTAGELRYLPDTDRYRLTLQTPAKATEVFEGVFENKRLILERTNNKDKQRLTINLLHNNRHLMRFEVAADGQKSFTPIWLAGVTKEGVPFASGDDKFECVVSGGLGTMPVVYKGKTYYVCCIGCRDAFNDNPAKYVAEFEARKAAKPK
jgi:hypothetical protein